METISIKNCQAVFGKGEFTYQQVLDDFLNTKFIGVITFNITPKTNSRLLQALKTACANGTNAVIITNIPKRFPSYYYAKNAVDAKNMIDLYISQLNPQNYAMRLNPYFNFNNHVKIVMTDNMVYWGSSNFSDESSGNYECGSISTDKEFIKYLKDSFFPELQSKSVPYFRYNFAIAIANLKNLILACQKARESLFDAAFEPWADYDTNFEEKWVYRTTDNGVTLRFLQGFINLFSQFEDALNVIDDIIDEYCELDELPEQVEELKNLLEEYQSAYKEFYDNISSLFQALEQMAQYDVSNEACRKIANDYGMEAYDENLDYYAEKAMNESTAEYEELIIDAESTIRDALDDLDCMIGHFEKINSSLYQLLEVNSKIDNTGVR